MTEEWKGDQSMKEAPDLPGEVEKPTKHLVCFDVEYSETRIITGKLYIQTPIGLDKIEQLRYADQWISERRQPSEHGDVSSKLEHRQILTLGLAGKQPDS